MSNAELQGVVEASYRRIGAPRHIVLALSGGADSVALFRLLCGLKDRLHFKLSCVHVHHGLRDAADEETRFVQEACDSLGVTLMIQKIAISGSGNLEERAREARHCAFLNAIVAFGGDVIALAHHQDDQAETFLMRLLNGAGGQGLGSMRELSGHLWRPLLRVPSSRLRDYLAEIGQAHRDDESNLDERFLRNAIRHRLMPVLQSLCEKPAEAIARTAGILGEENDFWADYADDFLRTQASLEPPFLFIMRKPLLAAHPAARRRIIRRFLGSVNVTCDFAAMNRIEAALHLGTQITINLAGGSRVLATPLRLHLLENTRVEPMKPDNLQKTPNLRPEAEHRAERFDADALEGTVLRNWQKGDIICPLGMAGSQSLGDYFTNRKVDRPFRRHWPLLCKGNRVLWLPGIGIAQDAAETEQTKRLVYLEYSGRLPHDYGGGRNDSDGK